MFLYTICKNFLIIHFGWIWLNNCQPILMFRSIFILTARCALNSVWQIFFKIFHKFSMGSSIPFCAIFLLFIRFICITVHVLPVAPIKLLFAWFVYHIILAAVKNKYNLIGRCINQFSDCLCFMVNHSFKCTCTPFGTRYTIMSSRCMQSFFVISLLYSSKLMFFFIKPRCNITQKLLTKLYVPFSFSFLTSSQFCASPSLFFLLFRFSLL